MNKFTIKSIIASAFIMLALLGCDDDDSAFSGNENYITSFKIEKDGLNFNATIASENITVAIPSNISLEDATVKIQLSENAKISPDPSSIKDWNSKQTFTVSSHNGKQQKEYTYEVERVGLAEEGDVVLNTQSDVAEFGAKSIHFIKGNLIVGQPIMEEEEDEDPINSLDNLLGLKGVSGKIVINTTYAGENLLGLANIETANSLNVLNSASMKSISLPKLTTLGDNLSIAASNLKEIQFPLLKDIGGSLTVSSTEECALKMVELEVVGANITLSGNITTIEMAKLRMMGQSLSLSNLSELIVFDLPLLKQLGHINITSLPKLESLSLASLEKIPGNFTLSNLDALEIINISSIADVDGTFSIQGLAKLETINAEKLKTVNGQFSLSTLPQMANLNGFKSLTTVGSNLTISYLNITDFVGLESLELITGSLQLSYNNSVTSLDGFRSLKSIEKELQLFYMPTLPKLDGFPALQSIKKFQLGNLSSLTDVSEIFASLNSIDEIYIAECRALEKINFHSQLKSIPIKNLTLSYLNGTILDLRGLKIDEAKFQSIDGTLVLKGDEIFEGNIQTGLVGNLNIEGIKEVENLTVAIHGSSSDVLQIPSIKKIRENLKYEIAYQSSVQGNLPDLEEIGGQFALSGYSSPSAVQPHLPKLKKMGSLNYSGGPLKELNFPVLEVVVSDLSINTFWSTDDQIEKIETPKLKTIGGKLSIYTGSSQYNNKLANLDFLNSLTKVGSVDIKRQTALVDYKGLKNSLSSLSSETWNISENGHNPTFDDLKAGLWIKP